jgi:hypothetical protein
MRFYTIFLCAWLLTSCGRRSIDSTSLQDDVEISNDSKQLWRQLALKPKSEKPMFKIFRTT